MTESFSIDQFRQTAAKIEAELFSRSTSQFTKQGAFEQGFRDLLARAGDGNGDAEVACDILQPHCHGFHSPQMGGTGKRR